MLNLEYSLTKDEFQEQVFYSNWLDPERKSDRKKYYSGQLFSYSVIAGIGAFAFRHDFYPYLFVGVFLIIGLLLFQYLKGSMKTRCYELADSLITKEGGEETILAMRHMDVSETGILIKTKTSELRYSWPAIIRKVVHNSCFYLFIGPRDAIIVPERIFTNKKDYEEFVAYLSRHLSLSADFVN